MITEKLTGEIINKSTKYKCFHILLPDQRVLKVLFDNILTEIELINGDLISFYASFEGGHLIKISDIEKIGNRYFDELDWIVNSDETIKAYVYKRTARGYKASYKGFSCFLPLTLSEYHYISGSETEDLLNKELEFIVKEVRDDHIILSRLEIDKESKLKIRDLEIGSLTKGETFMARIINVVDYGVFLSKTNSKGLLHISEILGVGSEWPKWVPGFYEAASSVFLPDNQLFVSVRHISEHDYSLSWNRDHSQNKPFWNKLYERLFLTEYFNKIKNALMDKL